MIDQIFAHARKIDQTSDTMRLELIGRTDAGQHEKLRRHERARRKNDLANSQGALLSSPMVSIVNGHGPIALDFDPVDWRVELDGEIGIACKRCNICVDGAAASALPIHELIKADAALA